MRLLQKCLHRRISALRGVRKFAVYRILSHFLYAMRLELHPARRLLQRSLYINITRSFFSLMLLSSNHALAETFSLNDESKLSISAYLEAYYLRDFNHPNDDVTWFAYSHNSVGKPSINLGFIKSNFSSERVRANIALGSGTYMRANYVAEPKDLQKILEANIGFKLSDNLWLDVGVMPSHIGFESAIGLHNWTVTRSMLADNSPYFETGVKLSYTSDDGIWYASGLVLSGWQRIQRPDGNTTPSIGHQLTYKPNAKLTLNSSSFIGNDKSDQERRVRYFHNFYGQYQINDQWGVIAALDVGAEQTERNSQRYNVWFTPIIIAQYKYSDKLSMAARAEYYQDKDQVIITTNTPNGFSTWSYSANLDYRLSNHVVIRTEIRKFHSRDNIFQQGNRFADDSLTATTAAIISF